MTDGTAVRSVTSRRLESLIGKEFEPCPRWLVAHVPSKHGRTDWSLTSTPPRPMQSQIPDPYAVLGVPRNASRSVMADAYRRLAKRYHPDVDPDPAAAGRMRRINAAWRELSKAPIGAGRRTSTTGSAHWSPGRPTRRRAATRPAGSLAAWGDPPGTVWHAGRRSCRAPVRSRRQPPRPVPSGTRFQDSGRAALLAAGVMVLLLFAVAYAGSLSSSPVTS